MNRYVFKKAAGVKMKPGQWRFPSPEEKRIYPGLKAVERCPYCEMTRHITTHHIEQSGEVNPSVVCRGMIFGPGNDDETPCGFHEFVKLEDYAAADTEAAS